MSFLQNLEKCCPETIINCFRAAALRFNKQSAKKKKKAETTSIHHLEEQQFQFTPSSKFQVQEVAQVKIRQKSQSHIQPLQAQPNLDIKLNLTPMHDGGAESDQKSNLLTKQIEELPSIKYFNFKLNLEPYSQYYQSIENKTRNLRQSFEQQSKIMVKKNDKSIATIKQIQTLTGFKLLISYRLPCSYSFYCKINKKEEIVMNLTNIISSSKIIEVLQPNLAIVELKFKKFMLLQPRFFRYVKYQNSSLNSHWQICVSTKNRPDIQSTEKECELTSFSCFEEDKEGLVGNIYLQVDLKSNIKASKVVQRVYLQLASYIDKLYQHVKQHYSQQSA